MPKFLRAALAGLAVLCAFAVPAAPPAATLTPPPIAAKSFILVDTLSGQTLAAGSEDDQFEPASLTKMMTAYLVFAALRDGRLELARTVPVPPEALEAGGARMFLVPDRPATVEELLKGLVVVSANDAAITLAHAVSGSTETFVAAMNEQARRLGLANTQFRNPTGRPEPGHHASSRDMATLAVALIRDFPERYSLYGLRELTYNRMTQGNRNRLLWTDSTVDGMKTGFTEAAGYCLVASARRGERRLVSVVMGAQTDAARAAESQKLLNFGFQAYDTRRLYKAGEPIAAPRIYKGTRDTAPLGFERDVWITLPRDRFTGLSATLETRQPFVAPLAAGQKAGIMKVMRENALVAELPVVALEEVPVAGFLSRGWDTLRLLFSSDPPAADKAQP